MDQQKDITLSRKFYNKLKLIAGAGVIIILILASGCFYFYLKASHAAEEQAHLKRVNELQQENLEDLTKRTTALENKIQNLWQLKEEIDKGGSPRPTK